MNIIAGKLKFKGAFETKMKHQKKVLQKKLDKIEDQKDQLLHHLSTVERKDAEPVLVHHDIKTGTGRILTSGPTVHGKDTQFTKELKRGDQIQVIDGTRGDRTEFREVGMIYSDRSFCLKEAFPRDVITYSQFDIQPQATLEDTCRDTDTEFKERLEALERVDEVVPDETVVEVKVKKGMWGYKTEKIKVPGNLSREDMVKMRAQFKKDKWS